MKSQSKISFQRIKVSKLFLYQKIKVKLRYVCGNGEWGYKNQVEPLWFNHLLGLRLSKIL